jgi:hypothetical protein
MEGGGVMMQHQEELIGGKDELGQSAMGESDQQDLAELVAVDTEDKEATEALIHEHRFDCVGSVPSSLLNARQRQHNIESCRVNIKTDLMLVLTKLIYRCQYYRRLANDFKKKGMFCEFNICAATITAKAGKFLST